MNLTALDFDSKPFTFYAAIDTGATVSMCSRNLAECVLGKWTCNTHREYKMFDGSIVRYQAMTGKLRLKATNGEVLSIESMTFVDQALPFAEYLDSNEDTPSDVDMIIGGDLVWKYVFCNVGLNENGCKFSN